jgi:hypothetical protein
VATCHASCVRQSRVLAPRSCLLHRHTTRHLLFSKYTCCSYPPVFGYRISFLASGFSAVVQHQHTPGLPVPGQPSLIFRHRSPSGDGPPHGDKPARVYAAPKQCQRKSVNHTCHTLQPAGTGFAGSLYQGSPGDPVSLSTNHCYSSGNNTFSTASGLAAARLKLAVCTAGWRSDVTPAASHLYQFCYESYSISVMLMRNGH